MYKERLEEVEVLRGITFLAIVLQHAIAGIAFKDNITVNSVIISCSGLAAIRFAVPTFIFITGLVLFYNSYDYNYTKFISKRIKQIFLPYFIWTIIYYLWVGLLAGSISLNLFMEIKKIVFFTLSGTACYHLWYIVMIFQFYITFPIFKSIFKDRNSPIVNFIILALVLVLNVGIIYSLGHYSGSIRKGMGPLGFLVDYYDRNMLSWIFYFVLGGIAGTYINKWRKFIKIIQPINIIIYVLCFYIIIKKVILASQNNVGNKYILCSSLSAPLNISMILFIISSIIFVYYISTIISDKNERFSELFRIIGKYSFGGYLIHAFVLHYTDWIVGLTSPFLGIVPQIIISFGLCSIVTIVLTIFINKTPASGLLVGKIK